MINFHPYLFFNGNCRQAMEFYHKTFGGELQMMTAAEAPEGEAPSGPKDSIMNASLIKGDLVIMASDGMPGTPNIQGDGCYLALNLDTAAECKRIFDILAEGGKVGMPLNETFWAESFGMCVDAFGVHWMLSSGAKG